MSVAQRRWHELYPLTNKDVSVRGYLHVPSSADESRPPFCFSPLLLKVTHSSLCGSIILSVIHSQHPPTLFSRCCKYRGLNGMVLYLDGRCAITQNRLDHKHTLGLRLEVCRVLSLTPFVSGCCFFFLNVSLPFFLSHHFPFLTSTFVRPAPLFRYRVT